MDSGRLTQALLQLPTHGTFFEEMPVPHRPQQEACFTSTATTIGTWSKVVGLAAHATASNQALLDTIRVYLEDVQDIFTNNYPVTEQTASVDASHWSLVLPAKVFGQTCQCVVDTGSAQSILHPKFVSQLLTKNLWRLHSAAGDVIPMYGPVQVCFQFFISALSFPGFVADIVDDYLLGMDFLQRYQASFSISSSLIILTDNDVTISTIPFEPSVPQYEPFPLRLTPFITLRTSARVAIPKTISTEGVVDVPSDCRFGRYVETPLRTHSRFLLNDIHVEDWSSLRQQKAFNPMSLASLTRQNRCLSSHAAVAECLLFPTTFEVLSYVCTSHSH